MYPTLSLKEVLADKVINNWPADLGVSELVYFSKLSDHFDKDHVKNLQDGNIHFIGEVLMWTKPYYANLNSTSPDLFKAVNFVKDEFGISEMATELYLAKSKKFRDHYLVKHFNDLGLIKNVAIDLGVSFIPSTDTLIGDRTYRKLQDFRVEKEKTELATLYRRYHLAHFLEKFTQL